MAYKPWQIDKSGPHRNHHRSGVKQHLKKEATRIMRYLGKRYLDMAPKKIPYCGYE